MGNGPEISAAKSGVEGRANAHKAVSAGAAIHSGRTGPEREARRSMIEILKIFAALALGYLLGILNTAVIVGKIYGMDIRGHGSKSAGLTNTLRVLGKSAAAFVLAGDVLKGI